MFRLVLKIFLLIVTLFMAVAMISSVFYASKLFGTMPEYFLPIYYGIFITLLLPCIGFIIYLIKSAAILSKAYNIENRDLSDRRPVDRNIKTHIPKIYWITGIIWGVILLILSSLYLYNYFKLSSTMGENFDNNYYNPILSTLISIGITLTLWVVVDLVSTKNFIKKYKIANIDEVDSIGEEAIV